MKLTTFSLIVGTVGVIGIVGYYSVWPPFGQQYKTYMSDRASELPLEDPLLIDSFIATRGRGFSSEGFSTFHQEGTLYRYAIGHGDPKAAISRLYEELLRFGWHLGNPDNDPTVVSQDNLAYSQLLADSRCTDNFPIQFMQTVPPANVEVMSLELGCVDTNIFASQLNEPLGLDTTDRYDARIDSAIKPGAFVYGYSIDLGYDPSSIWLRYLP